MSKREEGEYGLGVNPREFPRSISRVLKVHIDHDTILNRQSDGFIDEGVPRPPRGGVPRPGLAGSPFSPSFVSYRLQCADFGHELEPFKNLIRVAQVLLSRKVTAPRSEFIVFPTCRKKPSPIFRSICPAHLRLYLRDQARLATDHRPQADPSSGKSHWTTNLNQTAADSLSGALPNALNPLMGLRSHVQKVSLSSLKLLTSSLRQSSSITVSHFNFIASSCGTIHLEVYRKS